eukprot:m.53180 g.53180  ORF g.53180 m.53180 type:complete len:396 (+) comp11032_c0_seq1:1406-2593(+)
MQYCGRKVEGEIPAKKTFHIREPNGMSNGENKVAGEQLQLANVVFSVDVHQWEGVKTAINSILGSSKTPENIQIHLIFPVVGGVGSSEREEIQKLISSFSCSGIVVVGAPSSSDVINSHDNTETNPFRNRKHHRDVILHTAIMDEFVGLIRVENDRSGNLNSLANFARFLIPDIMQEWVGKEMGVVLYLDADVIVRKDVVPFLSAGSVQQIFSHPTTYVLAAVARSAPVYGTFFNERVRAIFEEEVENLPMDVTRPTYNAGVLLFRPHQWLQQGISGKIKQWMRKHKAEPLWDYGTQPLLLLATYNRWKALPSPLWNVDGLGYNTKLSATNLLTSGYILHWTGPRKPWLDDGLYKPIWNQFHPQQCSGHGTCALQHQCVCDENHHGKYCEYQGRP